MEIAIILAVLSAAAALLAWWKYRSLLQQIIMLKEKVNMASENKDYMKIESLSGGDLDSISGAFNELVRANHECRELLETFKNQDETGDTLNARIREIENSISRITVISDTGKKITGSLNVREIMENIFTFVTSLIPVEEMELVFTSDTNTELYRTGIKDGVLEVKQQTETSSENSLLLWSMKSGREALLNDAKTDYERFLEHKINSLSGFEPASVFCIPLVHHHQTSGAMAIYSSNKKAFDQYHVEIIRSLSSFAAVAIDNSNIYKMLEKNKEEIEKEKTKSDTLLLNILPADVAQELKETGKAKARLFENVTVIFTDFVNFTSISEKMSPEELVTELDSCFQHFDAICEKYGMEKIKTIGDAYLAVSGLPNQEPDHAIKTVSAAVEMANFMKLRKEGKKNKLYSIRLGIHSGPVVAGIVGYTKFAYDIWGDTVNTAARMEQSSEPGKINISEFTHDLIKDHFKTEYRGKINAKNKGEIDMYFVVS